MNSSQPSSFHEVMVNSIREGILIGICSRDEMVKHVIHSCGHYDACKENFLCEQLVEVEKVWKAEQDLAPKIAEAPRGTWALLRYEHNNQVYWKPLISDGSGDIAAVGRYNSFTYKPRFLFVHMDMIAGEIYKAWANVADAMQIERSCSVIQAHDIHEGTNLRNVKVPGYKQFSTVKVSAVDQEHGKLSLIGNYRGSSRKYRLSVSAALITITGKS